MIVFDALTLNTDRHRGNYGVVFDNTSMDIIRMAPVFDNNQALLPYAEEEDFGDTLMEYLASRPTRIGIDFNESANDMLTPEIISDLKNLKGFTFDRSGKYDLPEKRIRVLEEIVNMQIDFILKRKSLYISKGSSTKQTGEDIEKA